MPARRGFRIAGARRTRNGVPLCPNPAQGESADMMVTTQQRRATDVRVALLTNSLSPHTLPLCEAISMRVGELRAFVSAASDKFHHFPRPHATFSIVVQRSINAFRLRHRTQHAAIAEELHIPVDTLAQLRRYRPDVIVSCQFGARTIFAILYCLLHPRVRLVLWAALSTHTEQKRSAFRNALRGLMLRRADAAYTNGNSGERYLRSLGFTGEVCTVPYAIDDSLFRSSDYEPQAGVSRLLFCGRIDPIKGVLRFSRVLHRWCSQHPDRQVHFKIIGDGADTQAIWSLPALNNLVFELLPRVNQEILAPHYREADLFIFPSLLDEWGVVVNEAMSAGLPVLGSIYSQAVLELVADGANGWLCDPLDEGGLFATLDRALKTSVPELECMSAYAQCAANEITPTIVASRAVGTLARVCGLDAGQKPVYAPDLPLPVSVP